MIKKIVIGFGVFIFVLTVGVFLSLKLGKQSFSNTEQYRLAERHLLQDTVLQRKLGVLIIQDFGGYIYSDSAGIIFDLERQGGRFLVTYHLTKNGEAWQILSVEIDSTTR